MPWQETGKGNMLSASTSNGVFVSSGVMAMLTIWRDIERRIILVQNMKP
jgi:hypothetical protein